MRSVKQIMTTPVLTIRPTQSLKDAHDITRKKGIRHLPVVDESGQLVGVVTQKKMIAKVISLLNLYGADALAKHEAETLVTEIAVSDFESVAPDQNVAEVAEFFLTNKHGCLPVVENGQLCGILTSSDFVKLAVELLNNE